ncbi:MAG: M24 family metallopeptidase, partial [Chloroflexi bacterium]|nr:M24 family metallopeptidase [Chloroflexota bacterium]
HEPPFIREGEESVLKAGMTFTVEPGVYLPGRGGVRVEDDLCVTEDGSVSLTMLPREARLVA